MYLGHGTKKSTKVLNDDCESTSTWNNSAASIDSNRVTYDKNSNNQCIITVGEFIRVRIDKTYGVEGK